MGNLLEVKNVSKKYASFKLDDFSFNVPEGAIVGFIGRNGAGKTTTLKGIMNLLHFDSGEVYVFGKEFRKTELEAKKQIGFTLSELSYYPNKTIAQMVDVTKRFYPDFDEVKYQKLCKLFALDVNKKLQELSSGMKVKYSLAIALSYNAKLFILDEPTSGLDPISRDELLDIFTSLVKNGEKGILFSTHIASDLDKCATHIVYIHEGKKVYEGTKKDFINSYFLVNGKEKDFSSSLTDRFISHKEVDGEFIGLIHAEDKELFERNKVKIKKPDLEEIMVYLERGKDNEEFVL